MRSIRIRWRAPVGAVIAVVALAGAGRPACAETLFTRPYFLTEPDRTCTARNYTDPGTFHRQYRGSPCPQGARYEVRKGFALFPFDNESYLDDPLNGFLEILDEVKMNAVTGAIDQFRVFRDKGSGEKGMPWLPGSFRRTRGQTWVTNVTVEHWGDAAGNLVCAPTTRLDQADFSGLESVSWLGNWPGWLQDRRSSSLDKRDWHDVDVVEKTSIWGTQPEVTEVYDYGRWLNPKTSQWEGVGLVRYRRYADGTLTVDNPMRYLVDCKGDSYCPVCPP